MNLHDSWALWLVSLQSRQCLVDLPFLFDFWCLASLFLRFPNLLWWFLGDLLDAVVVLLFLCRFLLRFLLLLLNLLLSAPIARCCEGL